MPAATSSLSSRIARLSESARRWGELERSPSCSRRIASTIGLRASRAVIAMDGSTINANSPTS
jgi:hypothetical protein